MQFIVVRRLLTCALIMWEIVSQEGLWHWMPTSGSWVSRRRRRKISIWPHSIRRQVWTLISWSGLGQFNLIVKDRFVEGTRISCPVRTKGVTQVQKRFTGLLYYFFLSLWLNTRAKMKRVDCIIIDTGRRLVRWEYVLKITRTQ